MLATFSRPGEAGFLTTTFRNLSCLTSSPWLLAVCTIYVDICFSFFEPRGILLISAKYFHNSPGFNPSIASDIVLPFHHVLQFLDYGAKSFVSLFTIHDSLFHSLRSSFHYSIFSLLTGIE